MKWRRFFMRLFRRPGWADTQHGPLWAGVQVRVDEASIDDWFNERRQRELRRSARSVQAEDRHVGVMHQWHTPWTDLAAWADTQPMGDHRA